MSLQSLLYHAFGLKDQEYLKTEYEGGNVIIHVQTKEEHLCCASCKSKDVVRKGEWWRDGIELSVLGLNRSFCMLVSSGYTVDLTVRRFRRTSSSQRKKKYTRSLEKYVLSLLDSMTISDVATHLRMSWHTIKETVLCHFAQ
jgi:hypothetical protein